MKVHYLLGLGLTQALVAVGLRVDVVLLWNLNVTIVGILLILGRLHVGFGGCNLNSHLSISCVVAQLRVLHHRNLRATVNHLLSVLVSLASASVSCAFS
jgi:hypothetical protein